MPRFTIGIPTFNRASSLRRALDSACDQTWHDVEVLVSDDGSTDETEEVVRSYGDRVRYHRNPQNIGMWPNFARVAELAEGEYVSWLQDDDVIHRDFARRAVEALASAEDVVFYTGYAIYSISPRSVKRWDTVHGPMLPVDWLAGTPRVIDGLMAVPLCVFQSIAIFPAIAFRTSTLRRAVQHLQPDCPYYNENIVTAVALSEGKAVIDPWICAVHIYHSTQQHLLIEQMPDEIPKQLYILHDHLLRFLETLPPRWREAFAGCLRELPAEYRVDLLKKMIPLDRMQEYWRKAPPLALELRDMIAADLPAEAISEVEWAWQAPRPASPVKLWFKQAVPHRLWDSARLAKRLLRHGIEVRIR